MASDFNAVKDVPGYKMIMKAILKSQIQHLVDQLSKETEEESVILTASMSDGMLCHLGSNSGKIFLDNHEEFKSQFLNFCLKEMHAKQQGKSGVEDPTGMLSPSPVAVTRVTTHSGRRIKPVSKEIKSSSTPHGRRYKPYPVSKPSKAATSTVTSPTSSSSPRSSFIEILPLHGSEQSDSSTNTSQKENETSSSELTSIKIEPIDSGFMALPDTIEGYRIVQNELDRNDRDRPKTEELERVKETASEQTVESELASNRLKIPLADENDEFRADNDEIKPDGVAELDTEMDVSKPGSDNNDPDESTDMSRLEQPGPSGMSIRDTGGTEQRKRKQAPNRQWMDLVDEDSNRCDESIDDSEKEISNVYLNELTGFMEEEVRKDFERGDNELYYLVEHLRGTDVVKVINTLAAVLFTEDELIACSRTGKNTNKCIKGPRPPLDKMKLKKLERIVINKTQISLSVFNEKLANFQKVLRKKRQARIKKMMGFKHSPNETI